MKSRNIFPQQLKVKVNKNADKKGKNNELSKFNEINKNNSKNPFIKNDLERGIETTMALKKNIKKKISLINESKKNYSCVESNNILDKDANQALETNTDYKKEKISFLKYELKGDKKTFKNKSNKSNSNSQMSNNIYTLIDKMDKFVDSLKDDREKTKKMYEEERKRINEMYQKEKNVVDSLLQKLAEERIESNTKHSELVDLLKKNIKSQNDLNEKIGKLIGTPKKKK